MICYDYNYKFQLKFFMKNTMDCQEVTEGNTLSTAQSSVGRRSTRKRKAVTQADREAEPPQPQRTRKAQPKTGKLFSCDNCKSHFVINSRHRKPDSQRSKAKAFPRYVVDRVTQKKLTLCNACGLQVSRKNKAKPKDPPPSEDEKKRYYESSKQFAASLVEGFGEADAEKLTCPVYNTKPCGCIQKFIIGEGDQVQSKERASQLLQILKEAKRLREKKFYNREEVLSKGKAQRKVGLGNGHRKSKEYEEFVLSNRKTMRGALRMCERATQRILHYSNNFLHKRLKLDPQNRTQRLERTKGQAALGKLEDIDKLSEQVCCGDRCVMLAKTHALLLKQWRERAASGQLEARKVLAEMLTPSGQSTNCTHFIQMVTGSSMSTISRVKDQMWRTGGDREPPQHGLRKYWKNNPRNKGSLLEDAGLGRGVVGGLGSTQVKGGQAGGQSSLMTVAQLQEQQDQLKRLQQQLEEQQQQLRQQQRLVEQQLVQHQIRQTRQVREQTGETSSQRKVPQPRSTKSAKPACSSALTVSDSQLSMNMYSITQSLLTLSLHSFSPQTGETNTQRKVPQPRSTKSAKPACSAASTVSAAPPVSTQNIPAARLANAPRQSVQPSVSSQGNRVYVQPPVSTNQPPRSASSQAQPTNQQLPTIVSMNVDQQIQPQQPAISQSQQHIPQLQQQQPFTVAGLEGVDAKMLQHNVQQLLVEIQNQMLQQQLMSCGVQGPSNTSQPPSYSTAVAASNQAQVMQSQQGQKQAKDGSQQTQIIIQAIPGLPHNMLLGGNSGGVAVGGSNPQPFITQDNVSLTRNKPADNTHIIMPITIHQSNDHSASDETVNVEEVNVQLQEVVMPLATSETDGTTVNLPQLRTMLQNPIQQHPTTLGQLGRPSSSSHETRATAATINIDSLCATQQPSPSNMGDLVAETDDASRLLPSGEDAMTTGIPLVAGMSVETLLSPEALHILGSSGPPTLSTSLPVSRPKQSS